MQRIKGFLSQFQTVQARFESRRKNILTKCILIVSALTITSTNPCTGAFRVIKAGSDTAGIGFSNQIMPAQIAPNFSLKDLSGENYELSAMADHPMIVLYFFDAQSRPSQEGLLTLGNLANRSDFSGEPKSPPIQHAQCHLEASARSLARQKAIFLTSQS